MTAAMRHDDWEYQARCRTGGANWFPAGKGKQRRVAAEAAARICRMECPVRRQCAQFAHDAGKTCGVWGGVDLGDTALRTQSQWQADALRAVAEGVQ